MNEWMNEWMNGWMDEWMNEWMDGWMDEWMNECMYVCMCMHACMHACMHGWMDGWMDVRMYVCMYVCVCICKHNYTYIYKYPHGLLLFCMLLFHLGLFQMMGPLFSKVLRISFWEPHQIKQIPYSFNGLDFPLGKPNSSSSTFMIIIIIKNPGSITPENVGLFGSVCCFINPVKF